MVPLVAGTIQTAAGALHTSTESSSVAAYNTWANECRGGVQGSCDNLWNRAGLAPPRRDAGSTLGVTTYREDAETVVRQLQADGVIDGSGALTGRAPAASSSVISTKPGPAAGGFGAAVSQLLQSLTGQAQQNIGQAAGVAAAQKAQSTVLVGALIIGLAVVIGLALTRRK